MKSIYLSKITFFALLYLFFSTLALMPKIVEAYTVSPKVIDLSLEKRDIINKTVSLTNEGTRPVRIYPTVNEVSIDDDGEIKTFEQPMAVDRTETVTSWISISRGRIELKPGETKEVPLEIKINPQAKAGEYIVFVGFPNASNKDVARKLSMEGKSKGTIVRIALDQERSEFLRLDGFAVDRFVTDTSGDVMTYKLENTGGTDLAPRGEVIFYNTTGNEVSSIPINPEGSIVKEGEKMTFTSILPEDLKVGKYKAFLSLEYGNEQLASLNDTSFFYVVPLSVMILIFVSVLLFALILTILIYRKISVPVVSEDAQDVSMYLREGVSDSHEHDIDLKKQNKE